MEWTADLAYAIGLITTDGCLSKDGRHIELTSKDISQIQHFIYILNLKCKIGTKSSGNYKNKVYYRAQFGNVRLYRFLLSIGLTPHKSRTLKSITIPNDFFIDFLRGHLDGDGSTYSYWDPRWRSSFCLYTQFVSASFDHVKWLRKKISQICKVNGLIKKSGSIYQLTFAKYSSVILLKQIYYSPNLICLERKHSKIILALSIISGSSR